MRSTSVSAGDTAIANKHLAVTMRNTFKATFGYICRDGLKACTFGLFTAAKLTVYIAIKHFAGVAKWTGETVLFLI